MRRILSLLGLLSLACPKQPVETPDQPPPAPADPGAATAVSPVGCEAGPGWLGLAPCIHAGAVYAVGEMGGDTVLARAGALNQARARLVELGFGEQQPDGSALLRNSEGWDSFSCGGKSYALARRPHEGPPSTHWPACSAVVTEAQAVADCPAWTRRSAWREGETLFAVGAVQGIKNPALAATAAKNRALAEARKWAGVALKISDGGVSLRTSGPAGLPGPVETATCGDTLYAKVTVATP